MKIKTILFISIITLFIAGCSMTGNVVKENCNSPYITVGDRCCLDRNINNVCDEDESPTKVLLPSISETCSLTGKSLSCASIKAESNGDIKISLKNDKYGIASISKISLPGLNKCQQRYSGEVANGFNFKETADFTLKCDVSGMTYINTPIEIEFKRYEPSTSNGPKLAPYTIWDEQVEGKIISIIN